MIRAILTSTLLLFAWNAPAQDVQRAGARSPVALGSGDSRSPVRQGAIGVVYGAGATDIDGVVTLRIGSGRENDCGAQPWATATVNVISIDEAGTCRVGGRSVTQYRITYRAP
ncbi:hypothetical protein IAG41_17775 [Sphingomonas sp. JC676]|uniref:hypothetical protein n=1 Tax=Sphingomonas sp. JC676 TaxID=2768065 RepID=UPI0016583CD7|nr:hypothetical protein [Sphingomonas sp. JC676]MBC9034242.1 hypothetical protein [Sphingomonas sp. JC676]